MKPWESLQIAGNGRPIKSNFADWFGASKVVDKKCLPLVVYKPHQVKSAIGNSGNFNQYADSLTDPVTRPEPCMQF
jgi:hypothetical protein